MADFLRNAVEGIGSLRGVFVTAMPDCLLFASWIKEDDWVAEEVASYFGDLVRSNRQGLKALGSWSSEMQVTIESADALIVLSEVTEHFVCGCVFDRGAPLGMVRLQHRQLIDRISGQLPSVDAEELPRGARVLDFLQRYAPDPHAVLMRVAARTGLSIDELNNAQALSAEQVEKLEKAAKRILGLDHLNV